jgi:hypothetical protein
VTFSRLLLLPVLALALVVAGCGSEPPRPVTKAQYQQELARIGAEAGAAGSELGRSIDIATFNGNVDKFADTLNDLAGELDGLKPPPNVRAANSLLADSFRGFADEMEPVKDARRESIVKAREALGKVGKSQAVVDARRAIKQLEEKGYNVPELSAL